MKQGNQRIKGATFERKVAKVLKHIWPEARRGIQYRDGGKEASDIIGTPYHIECSRGGESLWAKWKQAQEDCHQRGAPPTIRVPIVIKQRDREEPVVLMSLSEWLKLCCQPTGWKDTGQEALWQEQVIESYQNEFGKIT